MLRRRKPKEEGPGCPVCLATEPMIAKRGKGWACRGCGSDGTYLGEERVPLGVPADDPFDYRGRRGEREQIVAQIRDDLAKIERERGEAA